MNSHRPAKRGALKSAALGRITQTNGNTTYVDFGRGTKPAERPPSAPSVAGPRSIARSPDECWILLQTAQLGSMHRTYDQAFMICVAAPLDPADDAALLRAYYEKGYMPSICEPEAVAWKPGSPLTPMAARLDWVSHQNVITNLTMLLEHPNETVSNAAKEHLTWIEERRVLPILGDPL